MLIIPTLVKMPTMYSNIEKYVDEAVNNIFIEYQKKYKVESGDCDPFASYVLDEKKRELANQIESILESQMPEPILCGFVWNHGNKDITAWHVALAEEDCKAIEAILEKYDGQGYSVRNAYDCPFSDVF